jgi:hypothetical protein
MWPFQSKKRNPNSSADVQLAEAFWNLQCEFGETEIISGKGVVALVLGAGRDPSGKFQNVSLKVASRDGGFERDARTRSGKGRDLQSGDVVIWLPVEQNPFYKQFIDEFLGEDPNSSDEADDMRAGWMGYVMCRLDISQTMKKDDFVICEKFY